jgi:glutamate racemase
LADSARAPYGSRPQKNIYQFTKEAVDYLLAHDCELVILACNTASAEALRKIQQEYLPICFPEKRVLGLIIPTAERVAEICDSDFKVGVVATEATVGSGAYLRELNKLSPDIRVYQQAAPKLVPLIESGESDSELIKRYIKEYTQPLLDVGVGAIILGCTHYAIIEDFFRQVLPKEVRIFNQSSIVAERLTDYLKRHPEIEQKLSHRGKADYLCTGDEKQFDQMTKELLNLDIKSKKVSLA